MQRFCEGALKAAVHYVIDGVSKVYETTDTPIIFYVRQDSDPTAICQYYYGKIVVQRYRLNAQGDRVYGSPAIFNFAGYGPIGRVVVIDQEVYVECRGRTAAAGCQQTVGLYKLPMPKGGTNNNPFYDSETVWIEGLDRAVNSTNPYELFVFGATGENFSERSTQIIQPSIICHNCPPGETKMGSCCINCDSVIQQLQQIRDTVRAI